MKKPAFRRAFSLDILFVCHFRYTESVTMNAEGLLSNGIFQSLSDFDADHHIFTELQGL